MSHSALPQLNSYRVPALSSSDSVQDETIHTDSATPVYIGPGLAICSLGTAGFWGQDKAQGPSQKNEQCGLWSVWPLELAVWSRKIYLAASDAAGCVVTTTLLLINKAKTSGCNRLSPLCLGWGVRSREYSSPVPCHLPLCCLSPAKSKLAPLMSELIHLFR